MGAFSALDQHVSPTYVAKYGTVKKFVQDLEDTERGLNISVRPQSMHPRKAF